ncbi:MAG: TraB/GumN family protein [Pseudomonadota bacterium]|nr:TraB/GumN family protein [Pseudomonadota bacterium]
MRILPPLLFAVLVSAGLLSLAGRLPAGESELPRVNPPIPLLWKVSDADNTVYLLGSFHLLKPDDYPLSADIDRAFRASESLVFEVPPGELADPATGQRFVAAAGYANGGSLSQTLPQATLDKLQALVTAGGGSMAQLEPFEPWFVNLSLVLGVSHGLGFSGELGLDRHLMEQAAKAGKSTSGLETIEVQLRMLDASPMDEQVAALSEFVERPQEVPLKLAELHQAWRSGDVPQLDRLGRLDMRDKTPETYRLMNVVRNQAWLPKIRALLDAGAQDTLVVVGALHLLGEDGLVQHMQAAGYDVERVCSACAVQATPAAATAR